MSEHHHTTTVLRPFFRDHPGELVPEENFWTLWCKGKLTEADTRLNHVWNEIKLFFKNFMCFSVLF